MTLVLIVGVEIPLLEGVVDRIEDKSIQAFGVDVLLDGPKDGICPD